MVSADAGRLQQVLGNLDSLVKPVLRKFQRFSTCERYRMLGRTRNRDCILYPGKGTVVLIRPAQTFYERINLVANALRHTKTGGTLTLRAEAHAGAVRIEVEDTGEGIPAEGPAIRFRAFLARRPVAQPRRLSRRWFRSGHRASACASSRRANRSRERGRTRHHVRSRAAPRHRRPAGIEREWRRVGL